MKPETKRGEGSGQESEERVELRYCPRCGVLGVQSRRGEEVHCAVCTKFLGWIRGEVKHAAPKL